MKRIIKPKRTWRRTLVLLVGILVSPSCLCCCILYQTGILQIAYLFAVGGYYYDLAVAKVPEFDRLNDELMTELPQYPGAKAILGSEKRWGPDRGEFLPAPTWPRTLEAYYRTNAPMSQILDFYEQELEQDGWKSISNGHIGHWFSKGQACVIVAQKRFNKYDGSTMYRVEVFYELNKLLGFPGLIGSDMCKD